MIRSWSRKRSPPVRVASTAPESAGAAPVILVPITGQTYEAQQVGGTPLAPVQWRLRRLRPDSEDGPYYACRLRDGSTQCDCAEWTYRSDATDDSRLVCKHLRALIALWWI